MSQHRLQILREAESIVTPEEPWPYNKLIVQDLQDLSPVDDELEADSLPGDDEMLAIQDEEWGEEQQTQTAPELPSASSSRQSSRRHSEHRASSPRALSSQRQEPRQTGGGAVSSASSDRSRATTPASRERERAALSPALDKSSPAARRREAARALQRDATPRPPSALQSVGKYRMLRCV